MHKQIFCFICKKPVDVQDSKAIAKLCTEHDTDENRKTMIETPIRQLLGIQDEGLQILVNSNQNANKTDLEGLYAALESIKKQIAALPTETTIIKEPAPNTLQSGNVNEFGEII